VVIYQIQGYWKVCEAGILYITNAILIVFCDDDERSNGECRGTNSDCRLSVKTCMTCRWLRNGNRCRNRVAKNNK